MYCLTDSYQQPHEEDTSNLFFFANETKAYGHMIPKWQSKYQIQRNLKAYTLNHASAIHSRKWN